MTTRTRGYFWNDRLIETLNDDVHILDIRMHAMKIPLRDKQGRTKFDLQTYSTMCRRVWFCRK